MAFTFAWPRTLSFRDCKRARLPIGELLKGNIIPLGGFVGRTGLLVKSRFINIYTAFATRPTMKCSLMHTVNPFLILCTCIVAAQGGPRAPALSQDKPEVKAEHISIATEDGGLIYADLYGKSDRGVVLAHGGRFTKESWQPQAQSLATAGFRVLAFDFRGFGRGLQRPSEVTI